MASGLLIVCVGRATKSTGAFMAQSKRYSGKMRLGESTPSLDRTTAVDATEPWEHVTDEELQVAARAFLGEQDQMPPMYSAISVKGQRLYVAARQGIEVEREARTITVEELMLRRSPTDRQAVDFEVACSKGTYVRSLGADIGERLGTLAHLTALRREASGRYTVATAWQLADVLAQIQQQQQE